MHAVAKVLPALVLVASAFVGGPAAAQSGCDGFWVDPQGNLDVPNESGGMELTLHAPAGCSYTLSAASAFRWLYVDPEELTMQGTAESIHISWDPGDHTEPRSGQVRIAGPNDVQFIGVRQAPGCSYRVSQDTFYFDREAHGGSFLVSTNTGCAWTASTGDSWVSVGASHTGTQTVVFSIEANPATEGRVGRIDITGGASVLVTQAATTGGTDPGSRPLGDPSRGGHGSGESIPGFSDEELAEMPAPPAALLFLALGLAAVLAARRRR